MTINILNPFKSQTTKTLDKSRIGRDVHAGECSPSAEANIYSGKIFMFGTATTVVGDNLSKAKSLEYVKVIQSSSLFDADIHVGNQKKILSKVKSVKDNITKLFKPTGRVSEAVVCIDPFSIPSEHSTPISSTPTPVSTLRHAEPKVQVVTAYESIPPCHTSSEEIASPVAYGKNAVGEHFEDLASTVCSLVEAPFQPPTAQPFTKPEFQLERLPSTFSLSRLHAIQESDGSIEIAAGVLDTQQKELATSGSYISQSNTHGVDLVSPGTNTSPADTSLAASVDAESSRQLSLDVLRRLRRVPNYEDLRNIQIIANRVSPCSDTSCGSSDCDPSHGAASGFKAAPLRRSMRCDNLRKSFLSFEPKLCTPSIRRMNKYKKFPEWLSRRCRESSRDTRKTLTSRAPSEPQEAISVSCSRLFFRSIFHPSPRAQAHAFKPSSNQPLPSQSPHIWSCAKITRSSSKIKKRRRMTKQSMRELKARLDSMDIDPWY